MIAFSGVWVKSLVYSQYFSQCKNVHKRTSRTSFWSKSLNVFAHLASVRTVQHHDSDPSPLDFLNATKKKTLTYNIALRINSKVNQWNNVREDGDLVTSRHAVFGSKMEDK